MDNVDDYYNNMDYPYDDYNKSEFNHNIISIILFLSLSIIYYYNIK